MKNWVYILFFFVSFLEASAQHCGTVATEDQVEYLRNFEFADTRNMIIAKGIVDIPIQFHIIKKTDGQGGVEMDLLKKHVDQLNELYVKANLRFVINEELNFIHDTRYYDFDYYDEEDLCAKHDLENAINIYCVNTIKAGYYGYTYHPLKNRKKRMLMSSIGWKNNSTFPHEMGHFFGLYHTHGKGGKIKELPEPIERDLDHDGNGVIDCYETGDDLCDTPSDPNMGLKKHMELCSQNCTLEGKIPSEQGGYYEPEITNIMCYNQHPNCRTNFTLEQYAKIAQTARRERKDIRVVKTTKGNSLKGAVEFVMEDQTPMPVDLDINLYRFENTYKQGDSFSFKVGNGTEERIFLGIINMDFRGEVLKVFPYAEDASFIKPKSKINPLGGLISLDNGMQDGKEYTCLLFGFEPINVETIVSQMNLLDGTFTQRLYHVLGNSLLPLDNVNYRKGNRISFDAQIKSGELLPIMLEMKQEN